MKWTSGALGSAIDVRGGDLLSVLLVPTGRGASSEAPVPVEAGKSTVLVTVGGSVQLK